MMIMTTIEAGNFSPSLSTGRGSAFSIRPLPLALHTTSINNDQRLRSIERIRGEQSHRNRRSRRRNLSHYSSSSPEFPQQYHDDPEDEWDNMIDTSSTSIFDRRKFEQRRIGVIPNDRRAMNVAVESIDEGDEWERYYDMDDNDGNGINIKGDDSQTPQLQKERARKKMTHTTKTQITEDGDEDGMKSSNIKNAITPIIGNLGPISGNSNRSVDDTRNHSRSPEIRNDLSTPDDESIGSQKQLTSNTQQQQRQQRISTEQINDIKASISLVDVIESYNLPQFTRMGTSHAQTSSAKACCPFHDDHNPSMSIDDSRGLYKCFACGAGGDVFNFIREFDYLNKVKDGKEKMGYMQAVEFVAREFGGGADVISSFWNDRSYARDNESDEAKENIRQREWKKERSVNVDKCMFIYFSRQNYSLSGCCSIVKIHRIRQANTAAAAFYTKCLVTLPSAGKARAHLRSRKLSPESVKTFAIGYAPDCYYGDEAAVTKASTGGAAGTARTKAATKKSGGWGSGSLVEYLADQGFAPNEIVESGLAVRTKTKQVSIGDRGRQINDPPGGNGGQNLTDEVDRRDYSDLMDRFRSRLIIPIMDENGHKVIALGARHLQAAAGSSDDDVSEGNDNASSSFTPSKYINSPDSLVFTKKYVLFNNARAQRALENHSSKSKISSVAENDSSTATNLFVAPPAIVLVEGYFDAIALSNVGIQNVVASMGTALPVEQLKLVAKMRNSVPGGKKMIDTLYYSVCDMPDARRSHFAPPSVQVESFYVWMATMLVRMQ